MMVSRTHACMQPQVKDLARLNIVPSAVSHTSDHFAHIKKVRARTHARTHARSHAPASQ